MMEWTIALLFGFAVLLLILASFKAKQQFKNEHREIDMISISLTQEINKLQKQIRSIEIDGEIIVQEAGIKLSPQERVLIRELLDLYKRGYSIEGIAVEKQMNENEIKYLLAPYMASKSERRLVANEG